MHCFYFVIESQAGEPERQARRVARIKALAADSHLHLHSEIHGEVVTLQVETTDTVAAVAFKLSAESALVEHLA